MSSTWSMGGFNPNFDADWQSTGGHDRFIVYQARMTWVAAEMAVRRPGRSKGMQPPAVAVAEHGLEYLKNKMWDAQYGGFYWLLDERGNVPADQSENKELYGQAFGIYAASNAARVLQQHSGARALAIKAYQWVEDHLHDRVQDGYFDCAGRDGMPLLEAPPGTPPQQAHSALTPLGYKSMNSHIHLLEAYTNLYRIWPDEGLRKNLEALFHIVRDRIFVEPGCLGMIYTRDWRAVPYSDSFGHDVETAYLLMETAEVLGDQALIDSTWPIARKLDDHALDWGFDEQFGGLYDTAMSAFGRGFNMTKVWWTQAEAMNSFLMMHEKFEHEANGRYWDAFVRTWSFVNQHQIDHERGGWHPEVARDGTVPPKTGKSNDWTACYHTTRALLNCIDRLRGLSQERQPE